MIRCDDGITQEELQVHAKTGKMRRGRIDGTYKMAAVSLHRRRCDDKSWHWHIR